MSDFTLFTITTDRDTPIYKLNTYDKISNDLVKFYSRIMQSCSRKVAVDYTPDDNLDEDEIFKISDFQDQYIENIKHAISNPTSYSYIPLAKVEANFIRGFFLKIEDCILFQDFEKKSYIHSDSSYVKMLFANQDQYRRFDTLKGKSIVLENKLAALYKISEKTLLFTKFREAKRVLDISDYYDEATNEKIGEFCNLDIISASSDEIIQIANPTIRKKILVLLHYDSLNQLKPADIKKLKSTAKNEWGLELKISSDKGKICLPSSKGELLPILRFLNNEYFQGIVDKRKYRTNAKRPYTKT